MESVDPNIECGMLDQLEHARFNTDPHLPKPQIIEF